MDLFTLKDLERAGEILEIQWQYRASRALMVAHQLRIFEALRQSRSAEEIASLCGTSPGWTEKLLTVCCALGLVMREGDRFELTELGRALTLPESLRNIRGLLDHGENLWWFWTGLAEVVRTGKRDSAPKPPEPYHSMGHFHWIWAMNGIAANGPAQWLASNVDLSSRSRLLDVGGGPGTYSIALCQKNPYLSAVIWDLPETLEIAAQVVKGFQMEHRIALQEGDWNKDEFGEGYDCLLMSNILHGRGSHSEMKLKKALRALTPNGLLIVHDFLLHDDRSGPLPAALFYLMVGAYTIGEMIEVIEEAGFDQVSLIAYNEVRGAGIVTAVKPS
ncbi:MAG: methyltransferase [Armatimonadetes bacterium]|nr:methyltransferase [Armatimonadota bacterium]MDW8121988.1 methyltransferase [Armatimonadota bacterium]